MRKIRNASINNIKVDVGYCEHHPIQIKINGDTYWFPLTNNPGQLVQ